jgi:hypothetical protein
LYFNFFSAAKYRLPKGKSKVALQALPLLMNTLSRLPENRAETFPKRLKHISQSTKAKIGKTALNIYPTEAVISAPFLGVGKDLEGLVYFFEFFLSSWGSVAVRMVLES